MVRPAALLLLVAALALTCSLSAAADADAAVTGTPKLAHPLGSGKNSPISLSYQPRRGRRFINLMRQFVQAARTGNMDLALKLQQQLYAITKPKGPATAAAGRRLLQPATDACPALANSQQITTPNIPPSGVQTSTGPTGPLPSIRFFTLEPCAEFGCRRSYTLVRQSDGTIICRGPKNTPVPAGTAPPVPPVAVGDFAYFKVYDYDRFWNTDADNVLAGAYGGSVLTNVNQVTSARGALGLSSNLGTNTQVRVQPNPFLAVKGDTAASGEVSTGAEVSKAVGDIAVLGLKTALPVLKAEGAYGAVLPGTKVTDRAGDASDDNIVFRTDRPALFGYFGKKH